MEVEESWKGRAQTSFGQGKIWKGRRVHEPCEARGQFHFSSIDFGLNVDCHPGFHWALSRGAPFFATGLVFALGGICLKEN